MEGFWKDKKSKILIVDDEEMNRRLAARMLQEWYDISEADSGAQCLEMLEENKPDLILLDVHMHGMDGYEVIRRLKNVDEWCDIPVVFLTADCDEEAEVKGLQAGAMDFLTKPFRREIFLQRINRILELSFLQKNLRREVAVQRHIAQESQKLVQNIAQGNGMLRDELTGLLLRREGEIEITQAMLEGPGCLAFIDLDNMKRINDIYGHACGDKLLIMLGQIIRDDNGDQVSCRLGGDEFLYFMPGANREEAASRIVGILMAFEHAKRDEEAFKAASISAGVVETRPGDFFDDAYNKADKALYFVKQNGKAGYSFYQDPKDPNVQSQRIDLRRLSVGLQNSGAYTGAMDVDYRQFTKLYEYMKNLARRVNRQYRLVMLTLAGEMEKLTDDEKEKVVEKLEQAVRKGMRSTDIFTRFSENQLLVLMMEIDDEKAETAVGRVERIFFSDNAAQPGVILQHAMTDI